MTERDPSPRRGSPRAPFGARGRSRRTRPWLVLGVLLLLAPVLGFRCVAYPLELAFESDDWRLRLSQVGPPRFEGGRIVHVLAAELENRGPGARVEAQVVAAPDGTSVDTDTLDFGPIGRDGIATHPTGLVLVSNAASFLRLEELDLELSGLPARDESGFEIDRGGQWYAGDFHVHATGASNDTRNSHPADIAEVARARGLSFVVLTDHSNSTGSDPTTTDEDPALFNMGPEFPYWERAAELSEPGILWMVDGNELSPRHPGTDPTGHVGCIPPSLDDFDREGAFVDRPMGSVTGAETLAQAREQGCLVVLNHPYGSQPWISFDWTSHDYDAIEVWNGGAGLGFNGLELQNHEAWRCDLLQGRDVIPMGNSDIHRVRRARPGTLFNPALGHPVTSVRARRPTWESIIAGARAGDVAIHGGDSLLLLDAYDGDRWHAEGAEVSELRVRGRLDADAPEPAILWLTRTTGCLDERASRGVPVVLSEEVLLEVTIEPGESFDLAAETGDLPGVYTARLHPDFQADPGLLPYYAALSRAVVVE